MTFCINVLTSKLQRMNEMPFLFENLSLKIIISNSSTFIISNFAMITEARPIYNTIQSIQVTLLFLRIMHHSFFLSFFVRSFVRCQLLKKKKSILFFLLQRKEEELMSEFGQRDIWPTRFLAPLVKVINKFYDSISTPMLCRNKAPWLAVASHVTSFSQFKYIA